MRRQTWIVCDGNDNELFRGCKTKAYQFYKHGGGSRCGLSIGHLILERDVNGNWIDV